MHIESQEEEILMRKFITTQEILQHHLKKIGYRTGINSIIELDSTKIKFLFDEDDDGQLDVIEIKTGGPAVNSENPADLSLIYSKNNIEEKIVPYGVTKFNLKFYNVIGNQTTERLFVKSIKVILRMESLSRVNGYFLYFENQFIVKPRNLG
jgi:hypothetical protein